MERHFSTLPHQSICILPVIWHWLNLFSLLLPLLNWTLKPDFMLCRATGLRAETSRPTSSQRITDTTCCELVGLPFLAILSAWHHRATEHKLGLSLSYQAGGLPGLPLFFSPLDGGFHLCDDARLLRSGTCNCKSHSFLAFTPPKSCQLSWHTLYCWIFFWKRHHFLMLETVHLTAEVAQTWHLMYLTNWPEYWEKLWMKLTCFSKVFLRFSWVTWGCLFLFCRSYSVITKCVIRCHALHCMLSKRDSVCTLFHNENVRKIKII